MNDRSYQTEEPIAALATPFASSALAVVRTSGTGAVDLVARCFSRPRRLRQAAHGTLHHGVFSDPESREAIDDVVLGVYRAPGGYTGEESVEIFCHGSLPGIQRILEALRAVGFRDAQPGEFTFRAFINGKMDLTRAEAVQEIVGSKSGKAHSFAFQRLSGTLHQRIDEQKQELADVLSILELQLDYAEDEIEEEIPVPAETIEAAAGRLQQLADTYQAGRLYHEGVTIALAGKTNAGKSSLFNLFLKQDRSIVSDVHGTTRDYIESWIALEGVPVRLYDTAGFRYIGIDDADDIEQEGMLRSRDVVDRAELVLYVCDGVAGLNDQEQDLFHQKRQDPRYLFLWNKCDSPEVSPSPEGALPVSAHSGEGFARLEAEILRRLPGSAGEASRDQEVMIDSFRQKELLDRAVSALREAHRAVGTAMPMDVIASELQEALAALGELTGALTPDDILDRIFSGFCVGK